MANEGPPESKNPRGGGRRAQFVESHFANYSIAVWVSSEIDQAWWIKLIKSRYQGQRAAVALEFGRRARPHHARKSTL